MARGWVDALTAGLGGYVAYRQGKDRKEDRELQRARDNALIGMYQSKTKSGDTNPVEMNVEQDQFSAGKDPVFGGSYLDKMANGGMVMGDRMAWQRQSFKKK